MRNTCYPEFIDTDYLRLIYSNYIDGYSVTENSLRIYILSGFTYCEEDINEIIDYVNELFV